MKEISRKVTKIQDRLYSLAITIQLELTWYGASLSDYQIRDLNDEINKLMREKHMWEVQLRNLGGPNYMRFGPRMYDEDGREVPGARGYKYFGRAKELPGVKELFEELKPKEKPDPTEEGRRRAEMRKNVDADYYGYNRDEEDRVLLEYERRKEQEAMENVGLSRQGEPPREWVEIPSGWKVPDLSEVNEFLVERRKSRLLAKLG